VVHGGKNFHGLDAGIDAEEFFVNFEDALKFAVERFARDVADVEVHGGLSGESKSFLIDDAMNGAGGDVTRNEIAVFGIPLFEKIEAFVFGNAFRGTSIAGFFRNPDAAAFAAGGFTHQAEVVFAGDGRGVNLNELAVRVVNTLLEKSGLCGAGADDGVGRSSE